MLRLKKEVAVGSKDDKVDMEDYPYEEYMDNVHLEDDRERHWRMVFEYNDGGVDYAKAFIYANMWDVCVNEK